MSRWSVALGLLAMLGPATGYAHLSSEQAAKPPQPVHVVRSGETLSLLAKRYRVSVKALADANGLARPNHLRVGQKLVIPRPSGRALAPPPHFVLTEPEFAGRALEFGWPVEGPVSSQFGLRRGNWHAGIDIQAEIGTPIFAAAPGTVYYSGWEKRYGHVVKIQHEDGFMTVYAHNLQNFVEVGDEVYRGQVIGTVGRSGRASSYHLHFEIRNNGKVYNPLHLLAAREVPAEPEEAVQPEEDDEDDE